MQEILEYVSKVTLGFFRPRDCEVDADRQMFNYEVNSLVDFHIDGVFVAQSVLKNVGFYAGRFSYIYWDFYRMHELLFRQIGQLQGTGRILQLWANDLPVATQNGNSIWHPYRRVAQEYADVSFGTDSYEVQDARLQDLCRKFWNT